MPKLVILNIKSNITADLSAGEMAELYKVKLHSEGIFLKLRDFSSQLFMVKIDCSVCVILINRSSIIIHMLELRVLISIKEIDDECSQIVV